MGEEGTLKAGPKSSRITQAQTTGRIGPQGALSKAPNQKVWGLPMPGDISEVPDSHPTNYQMMDINWWRYKKVYMTWYRRLKIGVELEVKKQGTYTDYISITMH